MVSKKCSICGVVKSTIYFAKKKSNKDGTRSDCKVCQQSENRKYYRDNKPRIRVKGRAWHLKKYGLTIDSFQALFYAQGGKCAICSGDLKPITQRRNGHTAIDHCHSTKVTRSLLCMGCNSGLGYFKDSVTLLIKAAKYIKAHSLLTKAQRAP